MSDRLQRSGLDGETAHRTSESGFDLLKIASITAIGSVAATGGSPIKVECNSVGMMSRQ
jgi:hypothetical protein